MKILVKKINSDLDQDEPQLKKKTNKNLNKIKK